MNKIFKVIYNHHTQSFQAVCEYGKSHTTTSSTSKPNKSSFFKAKILSVFVGGLMSSVAIASPTNGAVTAGQAVINQNELITNINQSSQNAAINWQSFNVGKNETVNFHQPNAQSVTLNRVIGNERSVIDGAMNANGKVFISNANGMLIGKNAQINVGSLVATTAKISDDDFMKGNYRFDNAQGSIENLGHISVPQGGVVALIAPIVKNSGKITAPQGKVLLASADSFSVTLPQDGFAYTLDKGTLQGLVDNGGAILADAGRVVLTAKGVDTVKKSLIKHSGNIEANTVQNKNGVIELLGDLDNSALNVSGSLKAEAKESGDGGFIETSANKVTIDKQAVISTNADNGKTGTWVLDPADFVVAKTGGDLTGAEVSQRLNSTNIQLHTINSNDGSNKNGKGDIIVNDEINWNKNTLTLKAHNDIYINANLNGTGTAKLALEYGQGTSDGIGEYYIQRGTRVNLPVGQTFSTKKGSNGEKLEFNVIHQMPSIKSNGISNPFASRNIAIGTDIDLKHTANHQNFYGYGEVPENEHDTPQILQHLDGLGHVISNLTINGDDRTESVGLLRFATGEIRDLKLENVNIDAPNAQFVGGLSGDMFNAEIKNVVVSGNIKGRQQVGGVVGALTEGGSLISTESSANVSGEYFIGGLAGEIDSKIEEGGRQIIINNSLTSGKIEGNDKFGGLIGASKEVRVEKSQSNATVLGNSDSWYVGGLIGQSYHNQIIESKFNGKVTGDTAIGGLIGSDGENYKGSTNGERDFTEVIGSSVEANISGRSRIGGLVGESTFTRISNSHSTGNVTDGSNGGMDVGTTIGGLIGASTKSTIKDSYSKSRNVIGRENIGGLIGESYGDTIEGSYSQIDNLIATGQGVGGLLGTSTGSTISNSYSQSNIDGHSFVGGLIGLVKSPKSQGSFTNTTSINNSFSAGYTSFTSNNRGQPQNIGGITSYIYDDANLSLNNVFYNKDYLDAQGQDAYNVGIPKTESELKQKSTFAGWDETIWDIQDGKLPTLRHTTNTVTTPTVPPVTPPINNVDFEPAKKSLADTKLYRQNMLNRMVIFAKNGEFVKLNIDQINDNIRKEIAKTQALIDVLPDGAEKTNLQISLMLSRHLLVMKSKMPKKSLTMLPQKNKKSNNAKSKPKKTKKRPMMR